MKILFTRGQSLLSKAIRSATKEPVSHCALQFSFGELDLVIHSNLLGVQMELVETFLRTCEVVYAIENSEESLKSKMLALLEIREHKLYDFGALLFVGMRLWLRAKLKIPLPKANLWQSSGMFMCTEWVSEFVNGEVDSMITPYGLYLKLKASQWGKTHGDERRS